MPIGSLLQHLHRSLSATHGLYFIKIATVWSLTIPVCHIPIDFLHDYQALQSGAET